MQSNPFNRISFNISIIISLYHYIITMPLNRHHISCATLRSKFVSFFFLYYMIYLDYLGLLQRFLLSFTFTFTLIILFCVLMVKYLLINPYIFFVFFCFFCSFSTLITHRLLITFFHSHSI